MYRIIPSIFNILVLCLCIQTVKNTLNSPTYSVPQDTSPRVTSKYSASRPSSLFLCSNGRKIDHSWQCDGENDCGDNSDESHCPRSWHRQLEVYHKCHPNETYSCVEQGDKCILNSKVCDHQRDCPDGDDEGDHCRTNPCYELNCAHQCEANGTVPYCTCRDGFKLNDGSNCEDVNECDSRVCSQQCRNTKGGFECSCIEGYELVNRTMCLAKDTSPILYYSIGREIRGFDIRENISHRVVYAHTLHRQWTEITSIERYENLLFYVGTIKGNYTHSALIQVTLPTNRQFRHQHKLPFSDKYGRIEDIALDWIHGNLYLCTRHTIIVCRIEPFYCATIMTNLKSANSILVQPDQNRLIWSQDTREGEVGIFSTDLSGTLQRTKLIDDRNPLDQWPFDIVYDGAMRRLYWIDRNKCSIQNVEFGLNAQMVAPTTESSSSYQLSYLAWNPSVRTSRRMSEFTIQQSTYPLINHVLNSTNLDPIAMAVSEDWIYWTSSTKSSIFVSNKHNGSDTKMLIGKHKPGLFGSISLYHPLNYPNVSSSSFLGACFGAQDVCSDICLLSFTQPHYECFCPDHKYKINSTHCAVRSESSSVIVSFGNKMVRVYEDSDHVHPLMETHQYLIDEIAFNLDREELYAHDRLSNKIGVFALRDISKNPSAIWTTLVESRLRKVVSLVYDVNSDYLYWVDQKRGTFEVTSTRGPRHRAILHDHLEEPLSLALNAQEMKWYIGLKGESTRKRQIIALSMNGQNRVTFLESNSGIPSVLAFNPMSSELFWGDPELRQIKYILSANQSTVNTLNDRRVDVINSLAIQNNTVCWTNIESLNLYCNEYTNSLGSLLTIPYSMLIFAQNTLLNVNLSRVISTNQQPLLYDFCLPGHHRCDHLCLIGANTYSCACSDGYILSANNYSCSLKRNWTFVEDVKEENKEREVIALNQSIAVEIGPDELYHSSFYDNELFDYEETEDDINNSEHRD